MRYIFEIIIPQCHHKSFSPQQLMMSLESCFAQWPAFHKGSCVNFAVGSFILGQWLWSTYTTCRPPISRSRDGWAMKKLPEQSLYCMRLPGDHLLRSHSSAIHKDNADSQLILKSKSCLFYNQSHLPFYLHSFALSYHQRQRRRPSREEGHSDKEGRGRALKNLF